MESLVMPPIIIRTLGDMIDHRMYLTAHCREQTGPGRFCNHRVRLDMNMLIEKLGRDFEANAYTLPPLLKCSVCGSKRVGIQGHSLTTDHHGRAPDFPMGTVSPEHMKESRARDYARRRGRRNRLPEKAQAAIKAGAANLEKPKDV